MLYRCVAAVAAAAFVVTWPFSATAQPVGASPDVITCQRNGKTIDAEVCLRLLEERLRSARAAQTNRDGHPAQAVRTESRVKTPRLARRALAAASKQDAGKDDGEPKSPFKFLLRRSLDDIDSFAAPKDAADAAGAEFSWTRNGISGNHAWAARGVVAVPFVWENPDPARNQGYLSTLTLAPYMVFDRVTNTVDAAKNVDNLVFGFSGEAAYSNLWQATHIFRLRGEAVSSFEFGKAKNWAVVGEYQPIGNLEQDRENSLFAYLGTPIAITKDVYVTVTPKLMSEFRSVLEGDLDPIFGERRQVYRSGGKLTGAITFDDLFSPALPFYSLIYQASYGWMWDWLSQRDYRLFDTAVTLNLTAAGNFGLTFSYRRGELEETGAAVDETKAALAVKF